MSNACLPGTGSPISAAKEGIEFVLGHALFMKAVHGGKAKNDKIDSHKIAGPSTRRLLPHGLCLSSRDAGDTRSFAPPVLSGPQTGRSARPMCTARPSSTICRRLGSDLTYEGNTQHVPDHFPDPEVRKIVQVDVAMIDAYDDVIGALEWELEKTSRRQDRRTLMLLSSIHGVGRILSGVAL